MDVNLNQVDDWSDEASAIKKLFRTEKKIPYSKYIQLYLNLIFYYH